MELMEQFSSGLFFWQLIIFVALILLLRWKAWKPILSAVEKRESSIVDALEAAEAAKEEMAQLQSSNEELLNQARVDRDALMKLRMDYIREKF